MDKENLKQLNEIRKYLEIPLYEYKLLLLMALKYQNENNIREELLYEIIEEALSNIDYSDNNEVDDFIDRVKTTEETFNRALTNLGYQKIKINRK